MHEMTSTEPTCPQYPQPLLLRLVFLFSLGKKKKEGDVDKWASGALWSPEPGPHEQGPG